MLINTEVFGEIQIDKDKIIKFKEGLLGFEEEKEFAIINMEEGDSPFFMAPICKHSRISLYNYKSLLCISRL